MSIQSISGNGISGIPTSPTVPQASSADSRKTPITRQSEEVTQKPPAEASKAQLVDAVKAVNDFVKPINSALEFQLDDDTGKTVVKVIDTATKEVIRQFPSEEMLAIAKALDNMKGLLVQQKA